MGCLSRSKDRGFGKWRRQPVQGVEIAKPGHMPGVHHSSEGGGQGLLTIRFDSWFRIICPSGFKFFLASSLLGPGGDGGSFLLGFSLSFNLSFSHSHLFLSSHFSFSIVLRYIHLFLLVLKLPISQTPNWGKKLN